MAASASRHWRSRAHASLSPGRALRQVLHHPGRALGHALWVCRPAAARRGHDEDKITKTKSRSCLCIIILLLAFDFDVISLLLAFGFGYLVLILAAVCPCACSAAPAMGGPAPKSPPALASSTMHIKQRSGPPRGCPTLIVSANWGLGR